MWIFFLILQKIVIFLLGQTRAQSDMGGFFSGSEEGVHVGQYQPCQYIHVHKTPRGAAAFLNPQAPLKTRPVCCVSVVQNKEVQFFLCQDTRFSNKQYLGFGTFKLIVQINPHPPDKIKKRRLFLSTRKRNVMCLTCSIWNDLIEAKINAQKDTLATPLAPSLPPLATLPPLALTRGNLLFFDSIKTTFSKNFENIRSRHRPRHYLVSKIPSFTEELYL